MQTIIILDQGSQYTQLIARKIRELNVYCEIYSYNKIPEITEDVKGVILSGSPYSVTDEDAPKTDLSSFKGKVPVLGICYGAQLMVNNYGGKVEKSIIREYGRARLSFIDKQSRLMNGVNLESQVWMSHGDTIQQLPDDFKIICSTKDVENAGYKIEGEETYAIQFHPEVHHSKQGSLILKNFVIDICQCDGSWTPKSFVETTIKNLREQLQEDKVVLGLSGGVDSSVAAMLLHKAIGNNLTCIFVDNGLLRKNEFITVLASYKGMGLNVIGVNAKNDFYAALRGITEPEKKRKAIGSTFINVFDYQAGKIENAKWLAQGTIYPDVIESSSVKGPSQTIKSHHNVGGLPKNMKLKIVEPLRSLFKDEVRKVGKEIGLKDELLARHPFPGPGLAIRILGEITEEKIKILQDVDDIFISNLKKANLYNKVWQAGAILLPIQSVGVMGDERTYERVVALRAVESVDGMTADWCHLPYEFLADTSNQIINQVKGVNRVCYDISSKPPATIEWE
ncbi:MAG: glutamine-hydrolyzing GMP synthase [Bacteroidales bacterium]|jgi:GMP synthase (glutamine-hydrolysing)|nr:glutamine-hydrolyzing GMP synthase [Bacteroidales bacterium]